MSKILFLILSPGIVWFLLNIKEAISMWTNFPAFISQKISHMLSPQTIHKLGEMQYASENQFNSFYGRVLYNKATSLINELFDYFTFLSPRFYFQAGDGTQLTPWYTEPIAIILFPFWVLGIVEMVKNKKVKEFVILAAFAFIAFIAGQKSMAFLFPILLYYSLIAYRGFSTIGFKYKNIMIVFVCIYAVFLGGRILWLLI